MKKIFFSLFGAFSFTISLAQFSFGVQSNYTAYKGELNRSTAGAGISVSYEPQDIFWFALSYTQGAPARVGSQVALQSTTGAHPLAVQSEVAYLYRTLHLNSYYRLLGDEETTGKLYGFIGGGYVKGNYQETLTGSFSKSEYSAPSLSKGSRFALTVNAGVGAEVKIGLPKVFAEGGYAMQERFVNNRYLENFIPNHLFVNLGLKFPIRQQ